MSTCAAGECSRPAHKDSLCVGHYYRRRRGQSMGPLKPAQGTAARIPPKDPHDRLHECSLVYADAIESDEDNERAWANLCDSADWVALGVPKIPRLQRLGMQLLSELRAKMRAAYRGNEAPQAHADMHAHRINR